MEATQMKKALTQVKKKLKEFAKVTGEHIITTNVNKAKLKKAAKTKLMMDSHFSKAKELEVEYKKLQAELGQALPGEVVDTVEIVVDGVFLKKHPRNKLAGKLDHEKVIELAHSKGIFQEVTKTAVVVDEEALLKALASGKITFEEYQTLTLKEIIPVISIGYVDEEEA